MVQRIREGLVSDRVSERILWLTLLFFIEFFGAAVLSHFLLPEGFLPGKNSLADFRTSENLFLCACQIFLYNMLSVGFIVLGSAIARKKEGGKAYRSCGQLSFFVFILLDAVTLGTWSFTAGAESVPLAQRLLRTFDVVHNAGLTEMYGQLLITSALATKYLVMTEGKTTRTRSLREVRLSRPELAALIAGLLLMMTGALVESRAIAG